MSHLSRITIASDTVIIKSLVQRVASLTNKPHTNSGSYRTYYTLYNAQGLYILYWAPLVEGVS